LIPKGREYYAKGLHIVSGEAIEGGQEQKGRV